MGTMAQLGCNDDKPASGPSKGFNAMIRRTSSMCAKCFRIIPAEVKGIYITTHCLDHGQHEDRVEEDAEFVKKIGYDRTPTRMRFLIVNITDRCNDNCKLCYYPIKNSWDMPIEAVKRIADENKEHLMILSGGEPTCHSGLFDIVGGMRNLGAIVTNGNMFADMRYLQEYIKASSTRISSRVLVSISIQKMTDKKIEALANIRALGKTLVSATFLINSKEELQKAFNILKEYKDIILHARIRTPFNMWRQSAIKTLYNSTVSKWVKEIDSRYEVVETRGGNSIYSVTLSGGDVSITICCAPSIAAMDIKSLCAAPKMLAEDQLIYPGPLGVAINEGISKGWYMGKRLC